MNEAATATNPATPAELTALIQALPAHLKANFEEADRELHRLYGLSPGVSALVRLWLACGAPAQVVREFESAIMDITRTTLDPNDPSLNDDEL